jgi:cell division protein FtsW
MKQPDFGSAVVLLLLTFTMLFVAGAKVGYILGASILGTGLAAAAIRFSGYRYVRYLAWLHMDQHRQDMAYQPFQSVMSFGSGEWFGLGLGRGLQSLYLPEAHTDFVAAILGEELGFLGVIALCATYVLVVARGVRIALRAPDDFGSFLAFGLSTMFGVEVLVNLSVALALLPTKGLTLPFVSFGGSSLLVCCAGIGILLNISSQAPADEAPSAPAVRADPAAAPTTSELPA